MRARSTSCYASQLDQIDMLFKAIQIDIGKAQQNNTAPHRDTKPVLNDLNLIWVYAL